MKIIPFLLFAAVAGVLPARQAAAQGPTPKIVGGTRAEANEFGFVGALLRHDVEDRLEAQVGAAALIHPCWAVTAGHCVEGEYPDTLDLLLGATSLYDQTGVRRVRVAEIIRHPNYNPLTYDCDIALLLLAEPLTEYPTLPLIDDPELAAPGEIATAMGWGTTSERGFASTAMLKVELPILPSDLANLPDWLDGQVTENMLAAGLAEGGKDTCQGDSGGPLLVRGPGGAGWRMAGVVSWGDGCGRARRPGVYTRVSRFRRWILDHVAPGFSAWERAAGIETESPPDADGDGLPQWLEYAMKTNPVAPDPVAARPAFSFIPDREGRLYPALTFRRRVDRADFRLNLAASADLRTWTVVDPATALAGDPLPLGDGLEQVTLRGPVSTGAADRNFLRLEAGMSPDYQPARREIPLNTQIESRLNVFDSVSGGRRVREFLLTGLVPGQATPVTVESLEFRPSARVLNAETGETVAEGVLNGNVSALTFTPEAGVAYVIQAGGENEDARGYFGLTAGVVSTGDPELPAPSGPVSGELTVFDPPDPDFLPWIYRYDIWLLTDTQAGRPVTVNLTSDVMDVQLYLYDANTGMFLAEHDDISDTNTNARLVFTPLPGRTYFIMATTAIEGQTGPYWISVEH